MKVSVIGGGYVGLVSAAGLAEVGHQVTCMDVDAERVKQLRAGVIPIYEPGLAEMVQRNQKEERLQFTTSMEQAVLDAEILMIAVGTPSDEDGSADLSHVLAVAAAVGDAMQHSLLVVTKSTVPVGTADRVRSVIETRLAERGVNMDFSVASNPEFLAEGVAVGDFMKPDRIVIGVENEASAAMLRELYAPFNRNHEKLLVMDVRSIHRQFQFAALQLPFRRTLT